MSSDAAARVQVGDESGSGSQVPQGWKGLHCNICQSFLFFFVSLRAPASLGLSSHLLRPTASDTQTYADMQTRFAQMAIETNEFRRLLAENKQTLRAAQDQLNRIRGEKSERELHVSWT